MLFRSNDTATTEIYTLSLHEALPIFAVLTRRGRNNGHVGVVRGTDGNGNPIVISGNHGHAVRQAVYPKSKVLAYVMPPDYVLDDMAKAAKAAALAKEDAALR